MPNWCECDLSISGPNEELEKFLETVKSEESLFDFNRLIPYPEHFKELDGPFDEWTKKPPAERTAFPPPDGYNQGGYEWCLSNWGTKWNAKSVELDEGCTWEKNGTKMLSVQLTFETAWCAPAPVIKRASEKFPELLFELRYFEARMQFNGIFVCKHGEVERDECGPYFGSRGG